MDKTALRDRFLQRRKRLDEDTRRTMNTALLAHLKAMLQQHALTRVASFYPIGKEVDLRSLSGEWIVYYPKVVTTGLRFYEDTGVYERAAFQTTVPSHDTHIDPALLDAVVVPGLAFDMQGFRLGYGKGYYDGFLKGYTGLTVGVCYSPFIVQRLPTAPHDVAVERVITEKGVVK